MPVPFAHEEDLRRWVLEGRANQWVWDNRREVSLALFTASSRGEGPPMKGKGMVPSNVRMVLEAEMEIERAEAEMRWGQGAGEGDGEEKELVIFTPCGSASLRRGSTVAMEANANAEADADAYAYASSDSASVYDDSAEETAPMSRAGATSSLGHYEDEDEDEDEDDDWAFGAEVEEEWSKLAASLSGGQGEDDAASQGQSSNSNSDADVEKDAAAAAPTEAATQSPVRPKKSPKRAPTLARSDLPSRGSSLPQYIREHLDAQEQHLFDGFDGAFASTESQSQTSASVSAGSARTSEASPTPPEAERDDPFDLDVSFDTTMASQDDDETGAVSEAGFAASAEGSEEPDSTADHDAQSVLTFSDSESERMSLDSGAELDAVSQAGTNRLSTVSSAFSDSDPESEEGVQADDEQSEASYELDEEYDYSASTLNISESFFSCASKSHSPSKASFFPGKASPSPDGFYAPSYPSPTALAIANGGNDFEAVLHACIHGPDSERDLERELYWAERIARTLARPTMQPYEYSMRARLEERRALGETGDSEAEMSEEGARCASPEEMEEHQMPAKVQRRWTLRRSMTRRAARSQSFESCVDRPPTPHVKVLLARRATWRGGSPTPSEAESAMEAVAAEQRTSGRWRFGRSKSLLRGRTWSLGFGSKD